MAWPREKPVPAEVPLPKAAWTWLGAWRGARCVGRLRARWSQAELVVFQEVAVAQGENADEIATAMVHDLVSRLPTDRIRLYAEAGEEDGPLRRWLEGADCEITRQKIVVGRELPLDEEAGLDGLTRHSLREIGERAFAAALEAAAQDDPFQPEGEHDALQELHDLIDYAGKAYDPSGWFVLREEGQTVGVVLPQSYAKSPEEGSVFYIGVTPPFRGRGFGWRIHALGLQALSERGVKRYVGSSEIRNGPMLRVFEKNGCPEIARQLFYEPLARRKAAP